MSDLAVKYILDLLENILILVLQDLLEEDKMFLFIFDIMFFLRLAKWSTKINK